MALSHTIQQLLSALIEQGQTSLLRQKPDKVGVTIANGAAVSGAFAVKGARGISVQTPAAWTAADIGFDVSNDGTTYFPLEKDDGTTVKITSVTTDEAAVMIAPAEAWAVGGYAYARLHSLNTATEADVNQGAARILVVGLLA